MGRLQGPQFRPYPSRKQHRTCNNSPILTTGFWVFRERSITGICSTTGRREVSAAIAVKIASVMPIAVEHGMRITFPMLLMSTRDFGDWRGYLPRNPGFM
jgi:hypothetical protein